MWKEGYEDKVDGGGREMIAKQRGKEACKIEGKEGVERERDKGKEWVERERDEGKVEGCERGATFLTVMFIPQAQPITIQLPVVPVLGWKFPLGDKRKQDSGEVG